MHRSLLVLVAAACGSKQPSAPPVVAKPPPPAPPTCAEAAIILRGESDGHDEETRRYMDTTIRNACEAGPWPAAVLECIASKPEPDACISKLSEAQHKAYADAIGAWREEGEVDVPPPVADIACNAAFRDFTWFPPVVDAGTAEREWIIDVRRMTILHECDHGWSQPLLQCMQSATAAAHVAACLTEELAPDEANELTDKLTAINKLAAKIAVARKKPASIGCKQVVAVHYADAKWKTKLDGFKPAERKRMITESRTRMATACTKDSWSEVLRACIVVGGDDTKQCFEAARLGLAWGYPAAGTVRSVGIPDCDAYSAALAKVMACDKIEQSSRDGLKQGFDSMQAHIANLPADERAKLASGCRAGLTTMEQLATTSGC